MFRARADGVTADMPPLLDGYALSCHVRLPVDPDDVAVVRVHPHRVATVPSVLDTLRHVRDKKRRKQ